MKVKSESEVAQSCPTLSNPMDCSLPGSSVHGIFQARVLEWGAIAFSESHLRPLKLVLKNNVLLHKKKRRRRKEKAKTGVLTLGLSCGERLEKQLGKC